MEELSQLIKAMKSELSEKFTAIESRINDSEERITSQITTHINQKFDYLCKDIEHLRSELENQGKRLSFIEKQNVQRNLVFFGIEESEKSYFQLQENILNIINNKLKIKTDVLEIQSVKRFGSTGKKPRPISITLSTLGKKIQILKNKKFLEGSNMYIQEEFPKKVLEIRKELKIKQKLETEKGNTAYLKYDKLIIKDKKETTYNKRQLSESPTCSNNDSTTHNTYPQRRTQQQSHKKHRANTNYITSYMVHPESA